MRAAGLGRVVHRCVGGDERRRLLAKTVKLREDALHGSRFPPRQASSSPIGHEIVRRMGGRRSIAAHHPHARSRRRHAPARVSLSPLLCPVPNAESSSRHPVECSSPERKSSRRSARAGHDHGMAMAWSAQRTRTVVCANRLGRKNDLHTIRILSHRSRIAFSVLIAFLIFFTPRGRGRVLGQTTGLIGPIG